MPRTIQEQEINTFLGHIHLQRLKQVTFPQVNHLEHLIPSLLPVRTGLAGFARFILGSDNLAWFARESSVVCYRQCKVDGTNAKTSTSLSVFVSMYLPSMDEVEGGTDFNNIPCARCQAVLVRVPALFLIQSDELVLHKSVKTFSIDSFGGGYLFLAMESSWSRLSNAWTWGGAITGFASGFGWSVRAAVVESMVALLELELLLAQKMICQEWTDVGTKSDYLLMTKL